MRLERAGPHWALPQAAVGQVHICLPGGHPSVRYTAKYWIDTTEDCLNELTKQRCPLMDQPEGRWAGRERTWSLNSYLYIVLRENLGAFVPVEGQEKEKVRTCSIHPSATYSWLLMVLHETDSLLPNTLVNFLGILTFPIFLFVWFGLVSVLSYSRIICELGSFQASLFSCFPWEHALSLGAVWPHGGKWVCGGWKSLTLFTYESQIQLQYRNHYIVSYSKIHWDGYY